MTSDLRSHTVFVLRRVLPPLAVVALLYWMLFHGIGGYTDLLLKGAKVTILLAVISSVLATVLGLLGAWAKVGGGRVARGIAGGYTVLIRGIPDLVLILLIYYGGQRLLNLIVSSLGFEVIEVSEFFAGVVAIGFIYGAYLTETFRGAWLTVPRGQLDAGKALGLPPLVCFWKVLAPQLLRAALTGYANVWQVLVKSTAVVSVIGLQDIVNIADTVGKSLREQFYYMLLVLIFYLVLTIISENIFKLLERRSDRWAA